MVVRGIRIARGGAFGGSWFHVMLEEMFHERAAVQFLVVGTVRGFEDKVVRRHPQ